MKDWNLSNNSVSVDGKKETIYNNLRNSIVVDKGSYPFDVGFGSELFRLKREKRTERTRLLAVRYCKEATQWIIKLGRALKIDVLAEYDLQDVNRLNVKVSAKQADGEDVTFETFVEVV